MRQQDQLRHLAVLVELAQEGIQHRRLGILGIDAREIGAVAPVLAGAVEHHLHARRTALDEGGEDIGLLLVEVDRRRHGDVVERPHAIAQMGGALEIHVVGGLHHLGRHGGDDRAALAAQEGVGLAGQVVIGFQSDDAGARRRTALDLVQHARPGARSIDAVGAGAQQERLLQSIQGLVDRAGRGERAVIIARDGMRAAVLGDLRRRMVLAHQDFGEHLVVAQQHVVARLQRLDQARFQQQGLAFGIGADQHHFARQLDHAGDALGVDAAPRILQHAFLQAFGLADIEDFAVAAQHAVDAGPVGRQLRLVADQLGADQRIGGRQAVGRGDDDFGFFRVFGHDSTLAPSRRG